MPRYGAISLVDKAVLKNHVPLFSPFLSASWGRITRGAVSEGRVSILSMQMGVLCHPPSLGVRLSSINYPF